MAKKSTKKTTSGKQASAKSAANFPMFTVVRSAKTGQLTIKASKGYTVSKYVNKYPDVKIQRSSVKPRHLSAEEIAEMVKSMKVA